MDANMNNEVNVDLGEPIEVPSKILNIGDITIELCNELLQKINDVLYLTFTTDVTLNEIKEAFEGCTEIVYGKDSYKDYTEVIELSMVIDIKGSQIYRIGLKQIELPIEDVTEVQYALDFAIMTMSDEQALNCIPIFPDWDGNGKKYTKNDRCKYNGKLYKVLLDHTSQADWTPDTAVSLFVEVADPSIEYPDFKQPTGAHDAYNTGDKVTFNGKHYICKTDACTWSPSDYPAGWELVED